ATNTAAPRVAGVSQRHLQQLRAQIDRLDVQIVELVNKRASLMAEGGRGQADSGGDLFAPAREEEGVQRAPQTQQTNPGALSGDCLRAIFREIISGARALQKVLKIAYLGPEYSFSHLAAVERFGQAVEFVPVGSIATVFEEVDRGHVDLGVVPVENSTDGRVA